eukprot:4461994-Alexandrium_andersonii.AAC.1
MNNAPWYPASLPKGAAGVRRDSVEGAGVVPAGGDVSVLKATRKVAVRGLNGHQERFEHLLHRA